MKRERVRELCARTEERDKAARQWLHLVEKYKRDAPEYLKRNIKRLRNEDVPNDCFEIDCWRGSIYMGDQTDLYLYSPEKYRFMYVGTDGVSAQYPWDDRSLWPWQTGECPWVMPDVWRIIAGYLDTKTVARLSQVNQALRRIFCDETREPWVSLRKQLVRVLPPSVQPTSVREFYLKTVPGLFRSYAAFGARDFTILLALFFPFGKDSDAEDKFTSSRQCMGKLEVFGRTFYLGRRIRERAMYLDTSGYRPGEVRITHRDSRPLIGCLNAATPQTDLVAQLTILSPFGDWHGL
jgi:hypothetical protein